MNARQGLSVLAGFAILLGLLIGLTFKPADGQTLDVAPQYRYRNPDGSCVHCSTVHLLHWLGLHQQGETWKQKYHLGEYADRHKGKMIAESLQYALTQDGDERLLEYALASRRYAGVTWNGAHMVNLAGRIEQNGQRYAVILDNNLIERFKYEPWDQFIANWKQSGGWAVVILSGEVPPPTPRVGQ